MPRNYTLFPQQPNNTIHVFQHEYSISTPPLQKKPANSLRCLSNFKVTPNLDLEERGLDKRPLQEAINRRERREKQGEY